MKTKEYGGIDYFRMVAALLVVAIHTSPLIQINETSDFILTRIIGRVAVPFFIMATGFFMYKDAKITKERLKSFVAKTLKLYMIGIVVYIPINLYMGYFKQENLLIHIVKDIIWNGTMYHLWYLPGVVLGAIIIYFLINKLGKMWTIGISILLYMIGLFGDSYYGMIVHNEGLKIIYDFLFHIFDYTRNGLFFVPIFLMLGIIIKDQTEKKSFIISMLGLAISTSFMIVEGLLLHKYQLQRHDSMYILLIPTMYFLFHVLIQLKGKGSLVLRELSMLVYLIHPFMIVVVRVAGKILKVEELFINNNMIHFILVSIGSCIFGLIVIWIKNRMNVKMK